MTDPALGAFANKLELVPDPELDKLYPKDFAGWVAASRDGKWERVDILNPTGSVHSPIDAQGITGSFDLRRGWTVRELLALLHN